MSVIVCNLHLLSTKLLHSYFIVLKGDRVKRAKPTSPLVFRLEEPLHQRLEECAERLKLKKYTLGIMAIEAAVEAIERNGYRLVVPIEFQVAHIPAQMRAHEGSSGKYPAHRTEVSLAEDSASSSKGISGKALKDVAESGARAIPDAPPRKPKAP
jgi:hypothetical protein